MTFLSAMHQPKNSTLTIALLALVPFFLCGENSVERANPAASQNASSDEVIGVTEPSQRIDLSFPEAGMLRLLNVKEGDAVKKEQILAQLDCRSFEARREIAMERASSTAAEQSASATLTMREQRLTQLERLAVSDRANTDELSRARAEREVAAADVQLAREAKSEAALEARQIEAEIEQRTLRAPFDGVIARIHREVGATLLPQEGPLLTLVNLEKLDLLLYVDHQRLDGLKIGDELAVKSLVGSVTGTANVAFISPVVDASSGTVLLRLKLSNSEGTHRSGVKYRVSLTSR